MSNFPDLFWKNPQFQIHLIDPDSTDSVDKCTMIVSLMEKEKDRDLNKIAIGYDIYEVRQFHCLFGCLNIILYCFNSLQDDKILVML